MIGRMRVQDGFSDGDCIYIANLAADAVNGGFTSREVERTIRAIRLAFKAKDAHTDDPYYADLAARADAGQHVQRVADGGGVQAAEALVDEDGLHGDENGRATSTETMSLEV